MSDSFYTASKSVFYSPAVVFEVAEWVEGEKLSQSTADDVGELVNLGVITCAAQTLQTVKSLPF